MVKVVDWTTESAVLLPDTHVVSDLSLSPAMEWV